VSLAIVISSYDTYKLHYRSWYMVYPTYMPVHSHTGESHTLWVPPMCERPGIYAGYNI